MKNPYRPTVFGKGYIGEGIHITSVKSKPTKLYIAWNKMLERCYSTRYQEKYPTYIGCEVKDEWLNFQIFGDWYIENYIESFDLDKDILFKGNKVYSPETCCFVPQEINKLFTTRKNHRGEYPIGVVYHKRDNKFQAQINTNGTRKFLGYFNTPEEAFEAYKKAKEKEIKEMAKLCKGIVTDEVYQALINYKIERND